MNGSYSRASRTFRGIIDLDTVERTVIKLVNQIRMFDKSGQDGIYAPCDDTVIEAKYYTGSIDRTLNQDGHSTPGSALDNYTGTARPRTCPQLRALGLRLVDPGHRWKGSKVIVAAKFFMAIYKCVLAFTNTCGNC
ncbi:hypothetical protein E4U59_003406 [Claviceps monticola]|nr:hypothetical protein E4U59_003406 [Claviceps monticola]